MFKRVKTNQTLSKLRIDWINVYSPTSMPCSDRKLSFPAGL
jgi:hypothetical protein